MPELITGGYVYIACPPLYKISKGKKSHWVYTDQQRDRILEEIKAEGQKIEIQRYKGLGEMNADQLWETTLDPEYRSILKVRIEDAQKADTIFEELMGDDVEKRKIFIQSKVFEFAYSELVRSHRDSFQPLWTVDSWVKVLIWLALNCGLSGDRESLEIFSQALG